MTDNIQLSVREQIKKDFGVDLPISGGTGSSVDDPVIIDPKHKDWSDVEYSFIKYVNQALGRSWKLVEQTRIEYNGRNIDQLKLEIDGDDKNYCNYYFDVTDDI